MPISVRCSNILRYDPQQGQYVRCQHEFAVRDELAGRSVKCPRCGEAVAVPAAGAVTEAKPTRSDSTAPAPRPASPTPEATRPVPSRSSSTSQPNAQPTIPPRGDALDDDEFRLADPVETPKPAFPGLPSPAPQPPASPTPAPTRHPSFDLPAGPNRGPEPSQAEMEEKAPCAGCGRPLAARAVICDACGYHKGLRRRVDDFATADDDAPRTTGFERWLRRQLVDGDDPDAIRSVLIVGGLLLIASGACLFLAIGHLIWLLVAAAAIAVAGVRLGWWRLDPWRALLFLNRMAQWRKPIPPFPHRKLLDLRNMPITDDELANLKNLGEFEVLDLEGAPVTDHGLPVLYDYRNLGFIVLCDTQVTEQGAAQLQQALPTAWIWR